jgi:hypothetical protein
MSSLGDKHNRLWARAEPYHIVEHLKGSSMGLYHPLDGVTNRKYMLLYFLTPNKKNSKRRHQLLTGIDAAI